ASLVSGRVTSAGEGCDWGSGVWAWLALPRPSTIPRITKTFAYHIIVASLPVLFPPFVKGGGKSAEVPGLSIKATAPQEAWRDRVPVLAHRAAHWLHPAGAVQSPSQPETLYVPDQRAHMACAELARQGGYADGHSARRPQSPPQLASTAE